MQEPKFREKDTFKWKADRLKTGRTDTQRVIIDKVVPYESEVMYQISLWEGDKLAGAGAASEENLLEDAELLPRLYTSEDCLPNSDELDWNDKVLVLTERRLSVPYKKPEFQLWRGDGGFGCRPDTVGRAVYAVCLADDERARWNRGDFLGVLKPELVEQVMAAKQTPILP